MKKGREEEKSEREELVFQDWHYMKRRCTGALMCLYNDVT